MRYLLAASLLFACGGSRAAAPAPAAGPPAPVCVATDDPAEMLTGGQCQCLGGDVHPDTCDAAQHPAGRMHEGVCCVSNPPSY